MSVSRPIARVGRARLGAVAATMVALALIALLAVRSGGSSATNEITGPAQVVPPSATFYAETETAPAGPQGAALGSVVDRVLGGPAPLRALLTRALGARSWRRGVAPWLGDRAGLFVLEGARGWGELGVAVSTSSRHRARAALQSGALGGPGARRQHYRGVAYWLGRDGKARGIIGRVVVVAPEAALRAAVDAAHTGSLAQSDRFRGSLPPPDERFALAFGDLGRLARALGPGVISPQRLRDVELRLALINPAPFVAFASAANGTVSVDLALSPRDAGLPAAPPPVGGGLGGTSSLPLPMLRSMPGASWLGIELANLGQHLADTLSSGVNPGLPTGSLGALEASIARLSGLDLRRDVVPWIGSAALFAEGTGPRDLGIGLVIASLDPVASARTVRRLQAGVARSGLGLGLRVGPLGLPTPGSGFSLIVPGLPQRAFVFARGSRVVVAYGRRAALDALDAPVKLAATPRYRDAAARVGQGLLPTAYLVPAPALAAADALGLGRSPLLALARPYVGNVASIVLGTGIAVRHVTLIPR